MADWKSAEKRSFDACRETCPKVDAEADPLEAALADAQEAFYKYRTAEQEARDELRSALNDAYEMVIDLESQLEDSLKRIGKLENELEEALTSLKAVEN